VSESQKTQQDFLKQKQVLSLEYEERLAALREELQLQERLLEEQLAESLQRDTEHKAETERLQRDIEALKQQNQEGDSRSLQELEEAREEQVLQEQMVQSMQLETQHKEEIQRLQREVDGLKQLARHTSEAQPHLQSMAREFEEMGSDLTALRSMMEDLMKSDNESASAGESGGEAESY